MARPRSNTVYEQWSAQNPFTVTEGYVNAFLIAWGEPPVCAVCGKPIRRGQVAQWRLAYPKSLCHACCLEEKRCGDNVSRSGKSCATLPRMSPGS